MESESPHRAGDAPSPAATSPCMSGARSRAVLITGCSSGIGRDTALHLARAGWTVTASAWLLITLRAILPDRVWEAFLRTSYPQPGRTP